MNKSIIIRSILEKLQSRFETLQRASSAARAEATHEDSKAECKYDTRGLEAGYLANGQALQAEEVLNAIAAFEDLGTEDFTDRSIAVGAMVEIASGLERDWYFIGPAEGGTSVRVDGETITVITPSAPLTRSILGKSQGEVIPKMGLSDRKRTLKPARQA